MRLFALALVSEFNTLQEGWTALHAAVASGSDTIAKALISANADVDAQTKVV